MDNLLMLPAATFKRPPIARQCCQLLSNLNELMNLPYESKPQTHRSLMMNTADSSRR